MDNLLKIILAILTLLIFFQIIYSYITFSAFSCPDCPDCPTYDEKDSIVPSDKVLINYIINKFIDQIDDDTKSIDFLKENVLFANNYQVNFNLDSESIMGKIRSEIENEDIEFNLENLRYSN